MARKSPEVFIQETLDKESVREFDWSYEGAAHQLKTGITLATLRFGQKYEPVLPLDIITANCSKDEEQIPLIVLYHKIGPVSDFTLPFLTLDGFLTHDSALDRLQQFYGKKKIKAQSEAHLLVFVSVDKFQRLNPAEKYQLLAGAGLTDDSEFLKDNRQLFFPALAGWIANFRGNALDYHQYLQGNGLAAEREIADIVKFYEKLIKQGRLNSGELESTLNENFGKLIASGQSFDQPSLLRELYSRTVLLQPFRK